MSKKTRKFKVGDHVYWHDPDEGVCSGPGVIRRINGDNIVVVMDDGGNVGTWAAELELMRQFSVDIQQKAENTYQVWARDADDAEKLALERFNNGDGGEHEENFSTEVTNCEEIA